MKVKISQVFKTITLFSFAILMSSFLGAQTPADVFFEKGLAHYHTRNLDSAMYYMEKTIETDASYHEAYFRRALIKDKTEDLSEAIKDYSIAINLHPDPKYFNNRGLDKAISGDFEAAIIDYNEALRLDPMNADAYLNKGYALYMMGETEDACKTVMKAIKLNHPVAAAIYEEHCR